MRCAGVLLLLLLSLSALSASASEANEERLLRENAMPITGRKWLRGRKAMAAAGRLGHGGVVVVEGKGGGEEKNKKNTGANTAHVHGNGSERAVDVAVVGKSGGKHGIKSPLNEGLKCVISVVPGAANQEADASAKAVNHEEKQSKGRASAAATTHVMFQEPSKHDDTAAAVSRMMSMDYKTQDARHHRPINNDAPLDHELVEKP
uniref:Uncharacterized protein n=1 Tax=Oryza glumipatula TaxID=40148 RepID=A0A0E0B4A9_9ORYZ